jgi:hypothetical protein
VRRRPQTFRQRSLDVVDCEWEAFVHYLGYEGSVLVHAARPSTRLGACSIAVDCTAAAGGTRKRFASAKEATAQQNAGERAVVLPMIAKQLQVPNNQMAARSSASTMS